MAIGRSLGEQISSEVQWCLNALISGGGFPAYRLELGSNPADVSGCVEKGGGMLSAQGTPSSGQCAQQWELRMMAQEAAQPEVASSKLRCSLAYNKTFNCAGVEIGDAVLCFKAPNRKSRPKWRGPACIADIDDTEVTARY